MYKYFIYLVLAFLIQLFCMISFVHGIISEEKKIGYYSRYEGQFANDDVVMEVSAVGNRFNGYFYYKKSKDIMRIDGSIFFSDKGMSGKITTYDNRNNHLYIRYKSPFYPVNKVFDGTFTAKVNFKDYTINGIFTNEADNQEIPFILKETYPSGTARFKVSGIHKTITLGQGGSIEISLQYPVVINNPDPKLLKLINNYIERSVVKGIPYIYEYKQKSNDIEKELDLVAKTMEDYYKQQIDKSSDGILSPMRYSLDFTIHFNDRNIICFDYCKFQYSGGAHRLTESKYYNYSLTENKEIKLNDLFVKGYKKKLTQIINQKLKEKYKLSTEESLKSAGYFVDNVKVSDNFFIQINGIGFFYNEYEIGPYSMGSTKIIVPYKELTNLIDPKGILGWTKK